MAAIAAETARGARASGDVFSGALLASGAAALFVGTLFYARLTPELGLPALPPERTQALADALKLGPQPLALAGGFAFLGDCLLLAACIALASRSPRLSNIDTAGWALIAVSVALATMFDSMTAALFFPLAHGADPALFVAVKSWFDFLFAAGNVPYGDQWTRHRARHAASAACHRSERHVRLRDSRRARRPDRTARSGGHRDGPRLSEQARARGRTPKPCERKGRRITTMGVCVER
jgi:hypothetical protein